MTDEGIRNAFVHEVSAWAQEYQVPAFTRDVKSVDQAEGLPVREAGLVLWGASLPLQSLRSRASPLSCPRRVAFGGSRQRRDEEPAARLDATYRRHGLVVRSRRQVSDARWEIGGARARRDEETRRSRRRRDLPASRSLRSLAVGVAILPRGRNAEPVARLGVTTGVVVSSFARRQFSDAPGRGHRRVCRSRDEQPALGLGALRRGLFGRQVRVLAAHARDPRA